MGVLEFDNSDDRLKWTTLTTALQNVSDGAWTIAVLLKRGGTGATTAYDSVVYLLSGSGVGTAEIGFSFNGTGAGQEDRILIDNGTGSRTTGTFTNTTSPYLFVLSKATGSVAPRLAWKLGSGGTWTHVNLDTAVPDQIASTMLEIGAWQTGDIYAGHIGLVACWEGAMSDANKEALDNNWRTSDLWNSAHGQPLFLAELNVAGASVTDLAGNASNLTATGTTLDAAQTLDSWTFDGTGASATPITVTPPADSLAGGELV